MGIWRSTETERLTTAFELRTCIPTSRAYGPQSGNTAYVVGAYRRAAASCGSILPRLATTMIRAYGPAERRNRAPT
jgi:hypothetical protein